MPPPGKPDAQALSPMAGQARLLRAALPGPGAASPRGGGAGQALPAMTDAEYRGSRRLVQRFEYSATSLQGFIELVPGAFARDGRVAGEQFKDALAKVAGVTEVSGKRFLL